MSKTTEDSHRTMKEVFSDYKQILVDLEERGCFEQGSPYTNSVPHRESEMPVAVDLDEPHQSEDPEPLSPLAIDADKPVPHYRHTVEPKYIVKPIIDVVMPSIPPREKMRQRAIQSVNDQKLPVRHIHIALDPEHMGAAAARNTGIEQALQATPVADFIAFLDDDDFWYPNHLSVLYGLHLEYQADFMYSWFDGNEGLQENAEFAKNRGRQFDPDNPHHTTMNVLIRSWLLSDKDQGGKGIRFRTDYPQGWELPQEDWRFILDCRNAGAKFVGTGEITWHYAVHGGNTSGLGSRWR